MRDIIKKNGRAARTREDLVRRPTTYEVIAEISPDNVIRLGFTAQRSKMSLLKLARSHSDIILRYTKDDTAEYSAKWGWLFGGIRVRFSGRTERECADLETERSFYAA